DDDQHERDEQPRTPTHSRASAVHSGSGLLHSRAARASSASSLGAAANSTAAHPSPAASAAAALIAAMTIEPRSRTSSANRRPARGEWISATAPAASSSSGDATGFAR